MIALPNPPETPNIRAIATWLDTHTTGSGSGSVPWANITGTPTTVAGYGISDAMSTSGNFLGTWKSYANNLAAEPFAGAPDSVLGLSSGTIQRYSQAGLAALLANATIVGTLDITQGLTVGSTLDMTTHNIVNVGTLTAGGNLTAPDFVLA